MGNSLLISARRLCTCAPAKAEMRQVPKFAKWKDCDVFARRSYRFIANEAYCQSARWSSIDAISRWEGKDKDNFWGEGGGNVVKRSGWDIPGEGWGFLSW